MSEERKERLGAVELQEGANAAERNRSGGQTAGKKAFRLGLGFQGPAYWIARPGAAMKLRNFATANLAWNGFPSTPVRRFSTVPRSLE